MKKHGNPIWILLASILPQAGLLAVMAVLYARAKGGNDPTETALWLGFVIAAGVIFLATAAYGLVCALRKKPAALWFHLAEVVSWSAYAAVLVVKYMNEGTFAGSAPLGSFQPITLAGGCLGIILLYGLVCAVLDLSPAEKKQKIWINLVVLAGIPMLWYLLAAPFFLLAPFLFGLFPDAEMLPLLEGDAIPYLVMIGGIVSMLVFLFFLVRLLVMAMRRNNRLWHWLRFPIMILLPPAGLLLNNLIGEGLFGDFSHPAFYVLAALNAAVILLPDFTDRNLRMLRFYGRGVTYTYILYFAAVFLPLTPLAFAGMLVAGLGLLMLVPLVLAIMQTGALAADVKALRQQFPTAAVVAVLVAGMLTLPSGLILSYSLDRGQLMQAMAYVYAEDYTSQPSLALDNAAVARSLENARQHHSATRFRGDMLESEYTGTPFLSQLYQAVALGNGRIPENRADYLERVFVGNKGQADGSTGLSEGVPADGSIAEQPVVIDAIRQTTVMDEAMGCYRTWVEFELKNTSDNDRMEFSTEFDLPAGVWISDYYLYVGNVKKQGLIADKRAAVRLYNQIVARAQDPGILYYTGANRIAFKVFPFTGRETRKTGFEVIHRQPLDLTIAGKHVTVAVEPLQQEATVSGGMAFIPQEAKQKLEKAVRPVQYYFIADWSSNNEASARNDYLQRIEAYIEMHGIDSAQAEVMLVNYEIRQAEFYADGTIDTAGMPARGGFFLDRAIKGILIENYMQSANARPVIIVATGNLANAVMTPMPGLEFLCPEDGAIYHLAATGRLNPVKLDDLSILKTIDTIGELPVLAWPDLANPAVFLPDDGKGSVAMLPGDAYDPTTKAERTWESALAMQGMGIYGLLHPSAYSDTAWALIKKSISTRILTPVTAFTVLETEEQEKELLQTQELLKNAAFSPDDEEGTQTQNMPEPPIWLLALPLLAIAMWKRRARRKAG